MGDTLSMSFERFVAIQQGACQGFHVDGKFQQIPSPTSPTSWQDWVAPHVPFNCKCFWAALDVKVIPDPHLLYPNHSCLIRLRMRLRGGGKESGPN